MKKAKHKQQIYRRLNCHQRPCLLIMTGLLIVPVAGNGAEEFSTFRITNVEGNAQIRYLFDEQKRGSTGQPLTTETRPTYEEEIFIRAQGYAYHPNFLKFEIGGGPVFQQSEFNSNVGSNEDEETNFNFLTRLSFLEKKPYPVALFYNQTHPSLSVGLTGRFQQENINYGIDAALLQPLSPVALTLNLQRTESTGQGFDVIVDDTTDSGTLRAHRDYGSGNFFEITGNVTQSMSRSGNPALPIQDSRSRSNTTNFTSRNFFGHKQQLRLSTVATYNTVDTIIADQNQPFVRNIRILPDLRWNHTENLYSFYRYSLLESDNGPIETTNQNITAGAVYLKDDRLNTSFDVHADDNQSTGQRQEIYGATGSVNYKIPMAWGYVNLSGALRRDDTRQDADTFINVIDESHQFVGTATEVTLNNTFVDTASIIVRLSTNTTPLTLNIDYEIVPNGASIIIRRLVGGVINDNDTILVTYSYLSQGSNLRYISTEQNYQFSVDYHNWLNAYIRYRDLDNDLRQGTLNFPLNNVQSKTYGIKLHQRFWQTWEAGGEVQFQEQDEDIAPFERQSYDVYLQLPLKFITRSSLRVDAGRAKTDNLNSIEDSDLTRYSVRITTVPWLSTRAIYEARYEKDSGGSVREVRREHAISFQWRLRKLTFNAEARRTNEEQGDFERERTVIRAVLRRDF